MSDNEHNGNERLTKVETEITGIREEMSGMWRALNSTKDSIDKLATIINQSNKTDWQTLVAIFGLIIVIGGAAYAAAIHPIISDVERGNKAAEQLADAVLIQNQKSDAEKYDRINDIHMLDKRIDHLEFQITHLKP